MKRYVVIILLVACGVANAQERLTLQDAIARTLKNNFDINMSSLTAEQAVRNNTLGNAGFLPNVSLNAGANTGRLNVKSTLVNGTAQNNPNAVSVAYTPNIAVNWTIFDGGRMFVVKKQLNTLEALGQAQLQLQIQAMVTRTVLVYAEVLWRQRQLIAIDTSLRLAKVRMEIADLKYETGAGAKIDLLQAQVDYNARTADSIAFIGPLMTAMDSLAILLADQRDIVYILDDSMKVNTDLQPTDKSTLEAENQALVLYRLNAEVSQQNARIARTYFLPTVALNAALTYNYSTSSTGFALSNRSYGGNGGFGLSMPLYQGGNIRREAKVACLQAIKNELLYEKTFTSISKRYRVYWRNYRLAIASYDLERKNILVAKENLIVQQVRFRVGIGTTLEVRTAENDYVAALERLYTAEYNLKVNEILVLELENQLVKKLD
jgi:outer membrane protein TolC